MKNYTEQTTAHNFLLVKLLSVTVVQGVLRPPLAS